MTKRRTPKILFSSIVALFLLFNGNQCVAQYHPFPVEDGIWVNQETGYYINTMGLPVYSTTWVDNFCANGNDTLINTISYKQVDYCSPVPMIYFGAWRYDTGKVFFVPRDSVNESLLYDFTLNTGDTAHVITLDDTGATPYYSMAETTIGLVDTVIVNGTPRRRLATTGTHWIEGVGALTGLYMEPWPNVSNYFRDLICMSSYDTTHYSNVILAVGNPGSCILTLGTENSDPSLVKTELFPNPTSGKVTVQMGDNLKVVSASLTNAYGQKIANYIYNNVDHFEIEIEGPLGLYFIEILTSEDEKSIVKVLKQ